MRRLRGAQGSGLKTLVASGLVFAAFGSHGVGFKAGGGFGFQELKEAAHGSLGKKARRSRE